MCVMSELGPADRMVVVEVCRILEDLYAQYIAKAACKSVNEIQNGAKTNNQYASIAKLQL